MTYHRRKCVHTGLLNSLVLFLSIFCVLPSIEARPPILARKAIVVEYFESCEPKKYPAQCAHFTFTRNGSVLIINGEEIIDRDSKDTISVQFRIDKCKDKSNPDTCEYWNTWKFNDLCAMKVMPFFPLYLDAHTPSLPCPFKKGNYKVKNAKIESNLVAQFLTRGESSRVMYKFHIALRENNLELNCINLALRVTDARSRH